MNTVGLYFHVPFCLSKCPYCDFYSVRFNEALADDYTLAVCRALERGRRFIGGRAVDTLYFGGGTPPLLGSARLVRILDTAATLFIFSDPEITLELNPGTASADMLGDLRAAGFNRVSFGVQSFIDSELVALGRSHDASRSGVCVLNAQKAGFKNISADLMLGIPSQTAESLRESIESLARLPVSHVSAYILKVEERTLFARQNKTALCPDEDETALLYLDCVDRLAIHGFKQYEISNFARDGLASRHNLRYWLCGEYLGIGPAAHSFIDGSRFHLPSDINAFSKADDPFSLLISDGDGGGFDEYVMLRLRLREGLDINQAASLYGADASLFLKKARPLEEAGLLTIRGGVIALTPRGFLLSNSIIAGLL